MAMKVRIEDKSVGTGTSCGKHSFHGISTHTSGNMWKISIPSNSPSPLGKVRIN